MIGVVLAGGAGTRMARPGSDRARGAKPAVELAGRPLIAWPAAALAVVADPVVVVCKASTKLPELDGVERWDEPEKPRHPLVGIVHALERAQAPVLVCAADMPFVTADACRALIAGAAGATSAHAAVALSEERLQPVFAVYAPSALESLRAANAEASLTAAVEQLEPVRVAVPPPLVRSVNTPDELAAAEEELQGPGPSGRSVSEQ